MTAQQQILAPAAEVIRDHLAHITRRWPELDPACLLEIAFLTLHEPAQTRGIRHFRLDQIEEAAQYVAGMNVHKLNAYAAVNPVRPDAQIPANKRASAEHIAGSFFHFAEADDAAAVAKIRSFQGPPVTFSVTTGTRPTRRVHVYWELEEPTRNLAAWKATQENIKSTFGTDSVVDAPRLMRLAGTINWPKPQKAAKGYVEELTSLRILDRPVTSSEAMATAFARAAAERLSEQPAAAASSGAMPHIATGEWNGVDVAALVREIHEGKGWHERVRSITAHLVAKGLDDGAIHLFTDQLTMPGFTVEQTRADAQRLVDDARKKGWGAEPETSFDAPPERERTSRYYSVADLRDQLVPPREWLAPALVPIKTVTGVTGDGGAGKSLLMHQLAVGVAAGCEWLGRPVAQGRVIYLSAEDDEAELHRRTDDILRAVGRTYEDCAGLTLRSLAGEDALLAVESGLRLIQSALFQELEQRAAEEAPALVLLDTAADMYPANENDRAKVRQFIGILRGLAIRQRCAVVLLSHPSLTGLGSGTGTSGSTAWNNSVRSRLYLSRVIQDGYEPDPDRRVLSVKKANYGRVGEEITMTWRDGVFVADEASTGLDRMAANAKAERVFLKLLDEITAQGRHVSPNPSNSYAPTRFAAHPDCEDITRRAFAAAMETLLRGGRIVIGEHGRGASRKQHLERAGAAHD